MHLFESQVYTIDKESSNLDSFRFLLLFGSQPTKCRRDPSTDSYLVLNAYTIWELRSPEIIIATIRVAFQIFIATSSRNAIRILSNHNRNSGKRRFESGVERNVLSTRYSLRVRDISYLLSTPILFPLCYTIVVKESAAHHRHCERTNENGR